MGIHFVTVRCCYCALGQPAPAPPALVTCKGCGRDFRIFENAARTTPIELSREAKEVLTRRKA